MAQKKIKLKATSTIADSQEIPDHILEYFNTNAGNREALVNKEIFKADKDVDVRTDLTWQEIVLINKIISLMAFMKKYGLRKTFKLYYEFVDHYLRLKISLLRKSRGEFVDVNRQAQSIDQATQLLNNVNDLAKSKK